MNLYGKYSHSLAEIYFILISISVAKYFAQLDPSQCGKTFNEPNLRIQGGVKALPNSWPSVAFLVFQYKFFLTTNGFVTTRTVRGECGATLIEDDKLLSAAHCFKTSITLSDGTKVTVQPNIYHKDLNSMYTIYLGLHDKTSIRPENVYNLDSFKLHPNFDSNTLVNDIAIIKLEKKATFNEKIQPACIPLNVEVNFVPDAVVWALGWGAISLDSSVSSDILKNVRLKFIDDKYCGSIKNDELCIGDLTDGNDTMKGDSGGPVYMKTKDNKQVVVGITSRGVFWNKKTVGIYARVDSYLEWIYDARLIAFKENSAVCYSSKFFFTITFLTQLMYNY
ncbi:transmembrane protease serine 13-like [Brachionus plicatilis]|uniref:Transmembrane protease serine 13-like n=1 Tax=Brachionus plicatilis TaxID=10195 RepID=A0A3M7PKW6_BRAPC|nr:transmembrane protease serine 13-like [Brachionus plicatilis]